MPENPYMEGQRVPESDEDCCVTEGDVERRRVPERDGECRRGTEYDGEGRRTP